MKVRHYWKSSMDFYEFLKVNKFLYGEDPVRVYNRLTLEYINRRENE